MEKSHFKADVRDIWTVDIGNNQMRFFGVSSNQLGKFLHGKQLSLVNEA